MLPPPPGDSKRSRVQELLIEFLGRYHASPDEDFAALCAAHPAEADELRRLYAAHRCVHQDLAIFGRVHESAREPSYPEGARVGDVIGDFRLIARLATGGQGEVWEAEQRSLERRVALKLVLPDRINEKTLTLFAREARAGGRLHHSGIVAVYGFGEDAGRHWIAQELIEGSWTLRDFIDEMRRGEELPDNYYRAVAVLIAELAVALQAAHDAGIIHRDVKPQNVLVTPDNHPKLTDFGLARITDESAVSVTGDFAGTWLYMSPEQVTARRIKIDHRTDIFSLGVVMYEMLALHRPFEGDTTHQIAEKIVYYDPPDLRKVRSRVPRDLAVICGKALEKRKDDRFATMAELADDLERFLSRRPILARPSTPVQRAVKWVRRNPAWSLGGALAAVAFVIIASLLVMIAGQKSDLEVKTAEAEAKAAEVLRLSASQDYEDLMALERGLWPAHPDQIEAYEDWIDDGMKLASQVERLRAKREELRRDALPRTEAERLADRESHPEYEKLALLSARIELRRRALAVRRGEREHRAPSVEWRDYSPDAIELIGLARRLVGPEREGFGQEELGLVLAERAAMLAPPAEMAEIWNTVAWARFELGLDAAALDAAHLAVESAPEEQWAEYDESLTSMEMAAERARSEPGFVEAEAEVARLRRGYDALWARVDGRRIWVFPEELEKETKPRWWNEQLTKLIGELESLLAPGTGLLTESGASAEHGWSIPRRLAFAKQLREDFAPGGKFDARWREDLPAIRAAYPGLQLSRQMGLVPIGADPESGLWEFWHVQSGDEPPRGDDGRLDPGESSGLVFVLLPGGRFWMGSQKDPDGRNYDASSADDEWPVHRVELSPFFLSKYEMTQGQWERTTGANPSRYGPSSAGPDYDLTHPVEQVSWSDCATWLPRLGLTLPTEAQWEYGARGGKDTPWWSGEKPESLKEVANLSKHDARETTAASGSGRDEPYDDGYGAHAPVQALRANPFGLHHVHGNLWEWCLDHYDGDYYVRSPERDPVNRRAEALRRVCRGGGFLNNAPIVRSANRHNSTRGVALKYLGVRPARTVDE